MLTQRKFSPQFLRVKFERMRLERKPSLHGNRNAACRQCQKRRACSRANIDAYAGKARRPGFAGDSASACRGFCACGGPRPVLLQFLRPRTAVVSPVLEGVSPPAAHRGEAAAGAAAGAAEAQQDRLLGRRDIRPRPAEAATRTNLRPASGNLFPERRVRKNHSRITDDRVPVTIHITRRAYRTTSSR